MPEPLLHGRTPSVDRERVGISYSGGGALLPVELGIARAFVELGVRPHAIAGVSAGAISAVAHALDPSGGAGIAAAAKGLAAITNRTLGLTVWQIALVAARERRHLAALGRNEPLERPLAAAFREVTGSERLTFDHFGRDGRPMLLVAATDRLLGERVEFPGDADVADALLASSAIPGVFPPRRTIVAGEQRLLVDGSVVDNQPLSGLALEGCGTIYACAVGYDGEQLAAPANLIDNWLQCNAILVHQATRLEQEYVQSRLGDAGVVHHIHPVVSVPVRGFDFSAAAIDHIIEDACEQTKRWITGQQLLPGGPGRGE